MLANILYKIFLKNFKYYSIKKDSQKIFYKKQNIYKKIYNKNLF